MQGYIHFLRRAVLRGGTPSPIVVLLTGMLLVMTGQPFAIAAPVMRTETVDVPRPAGLFSINLETQIYAPLAPGKHPLVVLSHGKAPGNPRFQESGEFYGQAMEFVKRGYVVLAPNRMGFSKSGGQYNSSGCDMTSLGQSWADDVAAAVDYGKKLPDVDPTHIVLVGQSQGGLVSVALASRNIPGVVAVIDFAGGFRQDNCAGWQSALVDAFGSYGKTAQVPALFMYGDNDSYFPQPLPNQLFEAYQRAGGHATLIDFGVFENDSHRMFHREEGRTIWIPAVENFLKGLQLPYQVTVEAGHSSGEGPDVNDIEALSAAVSNKASVVEGYRKFLWSGPPRAFAISADGHYGNARGADAKQKALSNCNEHTQLGCRLYAVDETVVFEGAASPGKP